MSDEDKELAQLKKKRIAEMTKNITIKHKKKEIIQKLVSVVDLDFIKEKLKVQLVVKFKEILPPMLLAMFGDKMNDLVAKFIDQEGENFFFEMIDSLKGNGIEKLDISLIVKEKIDALDFIEFEKLVYDVTKKELKHIEYVGLILGLLIGVVKSVVILLA